MKCGCSYQATCSAGSSASEFGGGRAQSPWLCLPRTASASWAVWKLAHHLRAARTLQAEWPLEEVRMGRHCTDRGWRNKKRKIRNQPSSWCRGAMGLCGCNYKHNLMYIIKTNANSKQNSQLTFTVLICIGHTAVLCRIFYSPGT